MSRFAYYSPFFVALLLAALFVGANEEHLPASLASLAAGVRYSALAGLCLLVGLHAQLVMLGCQGFFAQCLPVPAGKTIRGRGATLTGSLILLYFAGAIALVMVGFSAEGWIRLAAFVVPSLLAVAAAGAYVWNIPAAVRDFDAR